MISVIIPSYNASKYIVETISSVINQEYTDWEIIIIDDGSTDDTLKIIKPFCEKYPHINYCYQKNLGVSIARNNGMSKAKGDYIALLDADDYWEKDNLTLKVNYLTTKKIDWVFSNMYNADKQINIIDAAPSGTGQNMLENILLWKREVVPGPCSNIIFDRKCYDKGLMFDPKLSTAADQDFIIQLASKYNGFYINKPLWRYRILEGSMSKNIAVMEKDHIAVYKKSAKNKLFKNFWFQQKCFSNLYWILAGSWWKDGDNKLRGARFIILALITNPFSIIRIFKAVVK